MNFPVNGTWMASEFPSKIHMSSMMAKTTEKNIRTQAITNKNNHNEDDADIESSSSSSSTVFPHHSFVGSTEDGTWLISFGGNTSVPPNPIELDNKIRVICLVNHQENENKSTTNKNSNKLNEKWTIFPTKNNNNSICFDFPFASSHHAGAVISSPNSDCMKSTRHLLSAINENHNNRDLLLSELRRQNLFVHGGYYKATNAILNSNLPQTTKTKATFEISSAIHRFDFRAATWRKMKNVAQLYSFQPVSEAPQMIGHSLTPTLMSTVLSNAGCNDSDDINNDKNNNNNGSTLDYFQLFVCGARLRQLPKRVMSGNLKASRKTSRIVVDDDGILFSTAATTSAADKQRRKVMSGQRRQRNDDDGNDNDDDESDEQEEDDDENIPTQRAISATRRKTFDFACYLFTGMGPNRSGWQEFGIAGDENFRNGMKINPKCNFSISRADHLAVLSPQKSASGDAADGQKETPPSSVLSQEYFYLVGGESVDTYSDLKVYAKKEYATKFQSVKNNIGNNSNNNSNGKFVEIFELAVFHEEATVVVRSVIHGHSFPLRELQQRFGFPKSLVRNHDLIQESLKKMRSSELEDIRFGKIENNKINDNDRRHKKNNSMMMMMTLSDQQDDNNLAEHTQKKIRKLEHEQRKNIELEKIFSPLGLFLPSNEDFSLGEFIAKTKKIRKTAVENDDEDDESDYDDEEIEIDQVQKKKQKLQNVDNNSFDDNLSFFDLYNNNNNNSNKKYGNDNNDNLICGIRESEWARTPVLVLITPSGSFEIFFILGGGKIAPEMGTPLVMMPLLINRKNENKNTKAIDQSRKRLPPLLEGAMHQATLGTDRYSTSFADFTMDRFRKIVSFPINVTKFSVEVVAGNKNRNNEECAEVPALPSLSSSSSLSDLVEMYKKYCGSPHVSKVKLQEYLLSNLKKQQQQPNSNHNNNNNSGIVPKLVEFGDGHVVREKLLSKIAENENRLLLLRQKTFELKQKSGEGDNDDENNDITSSHSSEMLLLFEDEVKDERQIENEWNDNLSEIEELEEQTRQCQLLLENQLAVTTRLCFFASVQAKTGVIEIAACPAGNFLDMMQ